LCQSVLPRHWQKNLNEPQITPITQISLRVFFYGAIRQKNSV
jgi:hypothetical protein